MQDDDERDRAEEEQGRDQNQYDDEEVEAAPGRIFGARVDHDRRLRRFKRRFDLHLQEADDPGKTIGLGTCVGRTLLSAAFEFYSVLNRHCKFKNQHQRNSNGGGQECPPHI